MLRATIATVNDALGTCPFTVERPVMLHRWESLTFLHWSFAPDAVQRLLPPSLAVEPCEDRAWVGLVPFFMRVALPRTRSVPWVSEFCETNVRTYVRDDAGRSGIWFFSLDAARLGAVVTARTTYRLPYFWSQMSLARTGNTARHRFARAFHEPWPLRRAVAHTCTDELLRAAGLPPSDESPLVHYSEGVDVRIGRPER